MNNGRHRWRARLSAYIDGRLSPGERSALEAHLAGCEPCRKELAELTSVVALLRSVPQVAAPRSFTLRQAPAQHPWWLRYEAPLRFAATATVVLLVAVVVGDLLFSGPTLQNDLGLMDGTGAQGAPGPQREAQRSTADDSGAAFTNLATPAAALPDSAALPAPTSSPAPSPAETQKSLASTTGEGQAPSSEPPQESLAAPAPTAPTESEEPTAGRLRPWLWAEGALATVFGLLLTLALLGRRARRRLSAR
ncbi:MAG: zf-HC2 domain-containing protein [Chloroflexi bacterium]|nr:zf-HC2 domain-containing protein [Chloroflexota bacterium]